MAGYEHSYDVPDWWMVEFKRAIGEEPKREDKWARADLARRASELFAREPPWDTSRITKFLAKGNTTLELTVALAAAVGISPPFVEARTMEEANDLVRTQRRHDGRSNPETTSKVAAVAQRLAAAVKAKTDQTASISSKDEGSPRDPRTRRASSRR